jgi:hypothetical protein
MKIAGPILTEQGKQPNWWGRNWKWAVPVGCLGGLLLMAAVGAGIVVFCLGLLKSSRAYSEGVELARHNQKVVGLLGEPIQAGWMVSGAITVSGPSGNADLAIPLYGPQQEGTLYVVGHKVGGKWAFDQAVVKIDGHAETIDLLAKPPSPAGLTTGPQEHAWVTTAEEGDKPGSAMVFFERAGKVTAGRVYVLDPNYKHDLSRGLCYAVKTLSQEGRTVRCDVTVVNMATKTRTMGMHFIVTFKAPFEGNSVPAEIQEGAGPGVATVFFRRNANAIPSGLRP